MNVALVQNTEHDVDGDDGGENQDRFVGERVQEGGGGALIRRLNALREAEIFFGLIDRVDGVAERNAGREVERKCDDRKLSLVIDRKRAGAWFEMRERAQRNLLAGRRFYVDVFELIGILLELRVH